jgi:Right handed beta helix region
MHRTRTIAFLIAASLPVLAATQAHAVQRTHVSAAIGDDANTASSCSPIAPCRTFQAAMGATDPNGEVVVLDSGGYGAVVITQSVALIAPPGAYAGISVFGANGVLINTPGVNVVLRGLTINGQGGGNGIRMLAGNKLTVENCVISNLGATGIRVTGPTIVRVVDTIVRDNGSFGILLEDGALGTITRAVVSGSTSVGVVARGQLPGITTSISIADSIMDGNLSGVVATSENATATVNVSIRDSSAVGNSKNGLAAASSAGGKVKLTASNNLVSNNQTGIAALTKNVKIWASGNTVSNNTGLGLLNDGVNTFNDLAFVTAGNNAVQNNDGGDASGVITANGSR